MDINGKILEKFAKLKDIRTKETENGPILGFGQLVLPILQFPRIQTGVEKEWKVCRMGRKIFFRSVLNLSSEGLESGNIFKMLLLLFFYFCSFVLGFIFFFVNGLTLNARGCAF